MMKAAVVLMLFGAALAQRQRFGTPLSSQREVPILVDDRTGPDGFGNFNFRYQTGDGISHQAQGQPVGKDSFRVQGSYSYTSPEGELVEVHYVADENGFRAESPFIPVAPSPPPHALAQIRAAEEAFARQGSRQQFQPQLRPQPRPQPAQAIARPGRRG